MSLASWYGVFAAVATALNLGTQWVMLRFVHPLSPDPCAQWGFACASKFDLLVAMAAGTLIGLIAKYVLDKKYIFRFTARNAVHDMQKFFLYSLMGAFTTLIFLSTELAFDSLLPYSWSKYVGALVGLLVGYTTKFFCDRKFVFITERVCGTAKTAGH